MFIFLQVKGFSHFDENRMWRYSEKCVDTIREYWEKFPEVFSHINGRIQQKNYCADDVFSGEDKLVLI